MAPPKQPPKTVAAAKADGNTLLTDFYKRGRRGRPKRVANLAGDVIAVAQKRRKPGPAPRKKPKKPPPLPNKPPPKTRPATSRPPKATAMKVKVPRTNWSVGNAAINLGKAVTDWDENIGDALDNNGEKRSLQVFCNVVEIPYNTFKQYVCSNKDKRRVVGDSVGRQPLLRKDQQDFVADVLARRDRGNDGAAPSEAIELVIELMPELTVAQATRHFNRTLLPNHSDQLKQHKVKAQATTTRRSAITVEQQFRWNKTYEAALSDLRRLNTGVCRLTRKSFGELIHHFITGGDETCFQACEQGNISVIGSTGRKKHEKKTCDSRCSITLYRTGSVAGDTGPTLFLLAGKQRREGYTDKFLHDNGAAPGSTVLMTQNAFMTIEAWEAMTPKLCAGLRKINAIVEANTQWWMLEIFDGFGAHLASLDAAQVRRDHKILSLKEEADSSHANQAYDRMVAKTDKMAKTESLGMMRSGIKFVNKGVVDQWGLVHVGMFAIRSTKRDTWTISFHACNLDPRTRVSFLDWCKKIDHFLQAGQEFKIETEAMLDKYSYLPSFWHGMSPVEKRAVVAIVNKHGSYTVDCCKELYGSCHIPYKDMQNLRVCVECAAECPAQLDRGALEPSEVAAHVNAEVLAGKAVSTSIIDGLQTFELKPKGTTGEELFAHMIMKRAISPSSKALLSPSCYLDLEVSDGNRSVLAAAIGRHVSKREIMRDAGGNGANTKLAARKLDQMGFYKSHSGLTNSEDVMARRKNQFMLAKSVGEIEKFGVDAAQEKKLAAESSLLEMAPAAKTKLAAKNNDVAKLTKKEICALLMACYATTVDEKKYTNKILVTMLSEKIASNPERVAALAPES